MEQIRFLVVCMNPTFQKTMLFPKISINEVNRSAEYYETLAGKGMNTARVLMQLGQEVKHLTHLGGIRKEQFLSLAAAEGIPLLWVDSGSEIRTCTTLLETESRTTTELVEEPSPVAEDTQSRITAAYEGALPHFDVVVISGSSAPGYDKTLIPQMVRDAKALGKMVVLDIRGEELLNSLPYRPDIIKPNFSEFLKTFHPETFQSEHQRDNETYEFVCAQMLALHREYGTIPIITSGSLPTIFVEEGEIRSLPVKVVKPVNTIGSGDAFTAGLAHRAASGASIAEAVLTGQECGALNAERVIPGTIR